MVDGVIFSVSLITKTGVMSEILLPISIYLAFSAALTNIKSSNEIPRYINKYDLLLLCYTGDMNIAEMANPHKLLEYLSSGKPIVSHYIDEYKDHSDLLLMAGRKNEIPLLFRDVVSKIEFYNSDELMNKRKEFAKVRSYSNLLETIEDYFDENPLILENT